VESGKRKRLKMKKLIYKLLFLGLSVSSMTATSQQLQVITKLDAHRVVIRWMPMDAATWQKGNLVGYKLYKTVKQEGKTILQNQVLGQQATRCESPEFFEQQAAINKYAGIVANLLKQPLGNDKDENDLTFATAMLMSSTSQDIGISMGLLVSDSTIKSNQIITYTVELADGSLAASAVVNTNEATTLYRPFDLTASTADSIITLRWQPGDSLLNMAYLVERSEDGVNWISIDDNLILPSADPDSLGREYVAKEHKLPTFYKPYYFRVKAYTPFGELSIPSRRIQVEGYRQRFPRLEPKVEPLAKGVRYTWDFPDSLATETKGFRLYSSNFVDSAYLLLATLPPTVRSFTDTLATTDTYIKIALLDWKQNEQVSEAVLVSFTDSIPPANAVLSYKGVSIEGIVTLRWKPNTERDFKGYSVYRADNPQAEFGVISRSLSADTVFTDTLSLALLNKKVYYLVRAFDTRMNGSIPTDTIVIIRPDKIPPAALAFKAFDATDRGVELQWANSASDDVAWVMLLRKSITDSSYCVLASFSAQSPLPLSHFDTTGTEKQEYQYALVAIDEAGLLSEPAVIQLGKLFTGVRPPLGSLAFEGNPDARSVKITWPIPSRKVQKYILYRKGPADEFLAAYQYFDGKYGSFQDTHLLPNKVYKYRLQAIFEDDSASMLDTEYEFILEE
jgi:uncharacterized protein